MNAASWELVHDFGEDWQVELFADGSGPTFYASFTRIHWIENAGGTSDDPLPYVFRGGGNTWQPLSGVVALVGQE